MNILIIEDEPLAQIELEKTILRHYPDTNILSKIDSVVDSVAFLKHTKPDLIFMDIQLSDGNSFDIFEQVEVVSPVIFTTAFDQYAIQAFEANSIGYLLKPIQEDDLVKAVNKLTKIKADLVSETPFLDSSRCRTSIETKKSKSRVIVRSKDKLKFVSTQDIAYIFVEDKVCFAVSFDSKKHMVEYTLDSLEESLDSQSFFRVARNCIVNIQSIQDITRFFNGRLRLKLNPPFPGELFISRGRVASFIQWIDS